MYRSGLSQDKMISIIQLRPQRRLRKPIRLNDCNLSTAVEDIFSCSSSSCSLCGWPLIFCIFTILVCVHPGLVASVLDWHSGTECNWGGAVHPEDQMIS